MKTILKKKRKGSLLVFMLFAMAMAVTSLGTLLVSSTIYTATAYNSREYADIQTYRAATELAVYRYVNALTAYSVQTSGGVDWLTTTLPGKVDSLSNEILKKVGTVEDKHVWRENDILSILNGLDVKNKEVVIDLTAVITSAYNMQNKPEFSLSISDDLTPDWGHINNFINAEGVAYIELEPIEINTRLHIKGEILDDTFYVDGLHYNVTSMNSGTGSVSILLKIEADESGVRIYRDR